MKKILKKISLIISFIFLLNGCNVPADNQPLKPFSLRLAANYNGDWATDAIGYLDNNINPPVIAVVDTGADSQSDNIIDRYNTIDGSQNVKDNCEHGTYLTEKLLQLNKYAEIIVIKVTDDSENVKEQDLAGGIRKAVELNADIINISMGTSKDYLEIKKAVKEAIQKNITIVASAGNNGSDLMYPAKYDNVISVMARDINNLDLVENSKSDDKKSFSAPGEHILCDGEYVTGTSIASIYITNAVSYIKSKYENLKYEEVYDLLRKSCKYPTDYTNGLIDYNLLKNLV